MLHKEVEPLALSSVPLRRINDELLPTGIASGCLIDYRGARILLTAAHGVTDGHRWGIEVRWIPDRGTQIYGLGAMNLLLSLQRGATGPKEIDFAYASIPKDVWPVYQEIEAPGKLLREIPVTIHQITFDESPNKESAYGFCGNVLPQIEKHPGATFLACERRIYSGLTYDRSDGEFHVFKLPMAHPGHEHFQGCSGAPVMDQIGRVVGLVCHGDKDADEIWAISLGRYRAALDILLETS